MKKSLMVLSLSFLYGNAFAADFTDTASVISSTPIYERISEPKRECWTETVQAAPRERSIGRGVGGGGGGAGAARATRPRRRQAASSARWSAIASPTRISRAPSRSSVAAKWKPAAK